MRIAYFDETGDDGYPQYSSPLFILSAVYLNYLRWKESYSAIQQFRTKLKSQFGFPIRMEFHTANFVKDKHPYTHLKFDNSDKLNMLELYCDLIAGLDVSIISVCIVKQRIRFGGYKVLDKAFRYSIQRIENDLCPQSNPDARFMIITDEGRHGVMRKTSREMQRINYIPSLFGGPPIKRELQSLIEDPLPKRSSESYFVQLADLVSFVTYLYAASRLGQFQTVASRIRSVITENDVAGLMVRLKPSLNTKAAANDPYGVLFHPT